jgi:two-component system OmpR family sensor kinase/two-component system sensor histidine kinase BaeS
MHYRRRRLWRPFGCLFGIIAFFTLLGVGTLVAWLAGSIQGDARLLPSLLLSGCGVVMVLLAVIAGAMSLVFRRYGTPLADIMAGADAVADGDLSVQIRETGAPEFVRMAQSFNRMTRELQRADQQRRNLTADVAHELRTPLQIIQGNLEGVLDGVYQPDEEHIKATLEETRTLARLVEDLQTLSLAEAGELPLRKERVDVTELLADVVTSFSSQAEALGVDLRLETHGDPTALFITADPGRLDQVLGNLVHNALRHTPQGGSITLRAEPIQEGVRLQVSDTGEGIPAEDLPFIFDRFWRGDRSRARAGGASSGLGLAICKQLVQAHGGRIEVESQLGNGTTFTIELPQDHE